MHFFYSWCCKKLITTIIIIISSKLVFLFIAAIQQSSSANYSNLLFTVAYVFVDISAKKKLVKNVFNSVASL